MDKEFNLLAVDDNPDTLDPVLKAVVAMLKMNDGINVQYRILSKSSEVGLLNTIPADVVMFDCALSGEDYDFQSTDESRFGFTILQQYREKNRRTKIIFYSGSFDFKGEGDFDLTPIEFVKIINELNVFGISNREVSRLYGLIKNAIKSLDTILISMEDLIYNYGENGHFYLGNRVLTAQELLHELQIGSEVGEQFRAEVNSTIISYFMKFGDVDEK